MISFTILVPKRPYIKLEGVVSHFIFLLLPIKVCPPEGNLMGHLKNVSKIVFLFFFLKGERRVEDSFVRRFLPFLSFFPPFFLC